LFNVKRSVGVTWLINRWVVERLGRPPTTSFTVHTKIATSDSAPSRLWANIGINGGLVHKATILNLALRISVGSLTGLLTVILSVSVVCRSRPPTMRCSVSPLEKTDARNPLTSGRVVPRRDTDAMSFQQRNESIGTRNVSSLLRLLVYGQSFCPCCSLHKKPLFRMVVALLSCRPYLTSGKH
jgi:hypothetical protein